MAEKTIELLLREVEEAGVRLNKARDVAAVAHRAETAELNAYNQAGAALDKALDAIRKSDLVEILSRAGLTVRVGDDVGHLSLGVTRTRR